MLSAISFCCPNSGWDSNGGQGVGRGVVSHRSPWKLVEGSPIRVSCSNASPCHETWNFREARRLVAVDPVVKQSRLRESNERWKRWSLLHEFRSGNGASLRRITPSTQVGRLSESHSDIGFQLTQFPSGRKAKERKGDRSKHLKVF